MYLFTRIKFIFARFNFLFCQNQVSLFPESCIFSPESSFFLPDSSFFFARIKLIFCQTQVFFRQNQVSFCQNLVSFTQNQWWKCTIAGSVGINEVVLPSGNCPNESHRVWFICPICSNTWPPPSPAFFLNAMLLDFLLSGLILLYTFLGCPWFIFWQLLFGYLCSNLYLS